MTTEYPFTDGGLRAALLRLGRRTQKVARTLRKHQCLGDPDQCNSCPVAVWLGRIFGTDDVVVEGGMAVVTRDVLIEEDPGSYYVETQVIRAALPRAVHRFTTSFDLLEYPDLIKRHPKEPAI